VAKRKTKSDEAEPDAAPEFARKARALLKKIAEYTSTGGEVSDATKTEIKLFDARWKLDRFFTDRELQQHKPSADLLTRVADATHTMGDAAAAQRAENRDAEFARVRAQEAERRAHMGGYEKELAIMRGRRR
jgi:hypothetical protein